MNKSIYYVAGILLSVFLVLMISKPVYAYASDGEEYITISVDAEDNNGTLLYALDSNDPSAFGTSNEFSVPAGTDHTIYVKDAAGNISSQEFKSSSADYNNTYTESEEDEGRKVNIDVILDETQDYSDYEYAGDLLKDPAEAGQGTAYEKVNTDANDPEAQRIFYTVTTDEGEVFYLVIDQGQSSNNVYLLDQVNLTDLNALAVDDKNSNTSDESESLLSSLSKNDDKEEELLTEGTPETEKKDKKSSNNIRFLLVLAIAVIGGGFYYYQNVYKKKKDEQMDLVDAPDRDDFIAEEDDEDEEADFGLDEDYQEKTMAMLLDDDEIPDSPDDEHEYDEEDDNPDIVQEEPARNDSEDEPVYTMPNNEKTNWSPDDAYDDDLDAPEEDEE